MSQCLSSPLLGAEAYLLPLGKRKKGEEPHSIAWAKGAVWVVAGAEGLVYTALTSVLQDVAKGLYSAVGHKHAWFWRFSICGNLGILEATFHNRELEQPGGSASGCSVCWQDVG